MALENKSARARRTTLAQLLKVLAPDTHVETCTSGPAFEQTRVVIGMPFEDLKKLGKADELFGPFEVLFGPEHGRFYRCPSYACGRLYPKHDPRFTGEEPFFCDCDQLLKRENNADLLESRYSDGFEFNVVLDSENMLQAFTAAKLIEDAHLYDALLGPSCPAYGEIGLSFDKATQAVYDYFGDGEHLTAPVTFIDAGGVLAAKKNDLRYLAAVMTPTLQAASRSAEGRLVAITLAGSMMGRIAQCLGFDVIATAGPFAYLGVKDVSLPLRAFQKLEPAVLADFLRLLTHLAH